MSETSTMPFQPGTLADAPVAPEPDDAPRDQRVLLILAALGGLAVLLIAGYFLLFNGSSDTEAKAPAATGTAPQSTAQTSTAPSTAPKTAALPKISAKNFGTDPFKALLTEPLAADTTVTTAPTEGATTAPSTAPTTVPSTSYRFRVIDVAKDNESARVSVNGTAATVKPGDVFSEKFKAIRFTGGSCGTFQFGDERFDLCEGNTAKVG